MVEKVIFTNMCLLRDEKGRVLVQNRRQSWKGLAFPGGHVELGESFTEAVIREVQEETGLTPVHPYLWGIKHWTENGVRTIVLLYRADSWTGTLRSSEEGEMLWMDPAAITAENAAPDFDKDLVTYLSDLPGEITYIPRGEDWEYTVAGP